MPWCHPSLTPFPKHFQLCMYRHTIHEGELKFLLSGSSILTRPSRAVPGGKEGPSRSAAAGWRQST